MAFQTEFPKELQAELSIDEVYDILSDQDRRQALLTLLHSDQSQQLSSLALSVADTAGPSRASEILHLRLHHTHIPKMESCSLIKYQEDRDAVELTENGELLAASLE